MGHDDKALNSIVGIITVFVMDPLVWAKGPAKMALHYEAMSAILFSSNLPPNIALTIQATAISVFDLRIPVPIRLTLL